MELTAGRVLGSYRLVEKIGEGGMGVVWRATDTTLGRDVAIKVLPDLFAEDPDRLARFEREAKVLASLNHPGIATIHGLHRAEGMHFLAMELAPGTNLATRLATGPLPSDEAIAIALKVAEALEAAHDHGIVHRDLKPANIQVAPDGRVKILDFGLAKAWDADPMGSSSSLASMSPTLTTPAATRAGLILGTAAYMSPEQAKGKPVDRRADIWAFGCVLYEMLGGRRPFIGDGVSEVMAAVIMAPVDFSALPASLPARVARLVRRCMEKDPRKRLRDIGEARIALEETMAGAPDEAGSSGAATAAGVTAGGSTRRGLAFAAAAGAAVAAAFTAAGVWSLRPAPAPAPVRRFEIPAKGPFRSVNQTRLAAIAPDGGSIALVEDGKLLVRSLQRIDPVVIRTQALPENIFWSPDSAWIAFVASGKLYKAPAAGGESSLIADIKVPITGGTGATWCPDGRIVLSPGEGAILRVSSLGGDFESFIPLLEDKESDLHDPECLPDNSVLYVPHPVNARPHELILYRDGTRKTLLSLPPDQTIWFPVYAASGHILYRREPANVGIWALPFSLQRHEATGEPFLVTASGDVPSVARDGTLLHVKGMRTYETQMVLSDAAGRPLATIGRPEVQWPFPEFAPDGKRVALSASANDVEDIWIYDIERGARTRLSAGPVPYSAEAWSPDGRTLVYGEGGNTPIAMKRKSSDGGGEPETIGTGWGPSYSPDGRTLVYSEYVKDSGWDLSTRSADGKGDPKPFYHANGDQVWPRVSPDGHFVAFASEEAGDFDIYIRRFPEGEGKWEVSQGGGMWPRWGKSGRRLYYVRGDDIMVVDVSTSPDLKLGTPRLLFTRPSLRRPLIFGWAPGFDVNAAEDRFIFCRAAGENADLSGMVVVQNWAAEFSGPAAPAAK
ncbi:MAG TPA: protein kinase [Candidatus Polarisedimenticolia bacterium]|nr:protein kinase [Candidatus Polarisedimenticolia bacterium]